MNNLVRNDSLFVKEKHSKILKKKKKWDIYPKAESSVTSDCLASGIATSLVA